MVSVKVENAIIDAFLSLVGESSLDEATLPRIAERVGVTLATLRSAFGGRVDIVAAFSARTDKAVLDALDTALSEESARERLFDVLLSRLEHLAPNKAAIAALQDAARRDPLIALHLNAIACRSMAWMMAAAGIAHAGKPGAVRAQGLTLIWSRLLRVWLADDDPGLARTMAALDRHLRRGERAAVRLRRLECLAARICGGRPASASNTGAAADGA